jgi:hypothetical protein
MRSIAGAGGWKNCFEEFQVPGFEFRVEDSF